MHRQWGEECMSEQQTKQKKFSFREYGIYFVFILLVLVLCIISPNSFANVRNITNVLKQASINGILACGLMFIIISGGIDLSAGSIIAISGVMAAHFAHPDTYPVIVPILVAIIVGGIAGAVNGFGVAYAGLPPFIITLATRMAMDGIALIASGGAPVFGMSKSFENLTGNVGNISLLAIYFVIIAAISGLVLSRTVFGRRVYMVGGNEVSANVSGINVKLIKMMVYVIGGVLAGVAGLLLASRTVQGAPTAGKGYEMDAIAAVVIGGISMTGGAGKWQGTIVGALLLAVLSNGLDIMGVNSNYQLIIKGAIIAVAVYFDLRGKAKLK